MYGCPVSSKVYGWVLQMSSDICRVEGKTRQKLHFLARGKHLHLNYNGMQDSRRCSGKLLEYRLYHMLKKSPLPIFLPQSVYLHVVRLALGVDSIPDSLNSICSDYRNTETYVSRSEKLHYKQ